MHVLPPNAEPYLILLSEAKPYHSDIVSKFRRELNQATGTFFFLLLSFIWLISIHDNLQTEIEMI